MTDRTSTMPAVLLACALSVPALAASIPAEDISEALMGFYQAPSPERFDAIQAGLAANLAAFETGKDGVATPTATFLARVHQKHGWPLRDVGGLDELARSIAGRDGSEIALFVNDDGWVTPSKLDVWWSSFFATGETRYIDRIVAQLRDPAEVKADPTAPSHLVAAAASWALGANARQHPTVMAHLRSLLEAEPPLAETPWLATIVSKARRARLVELDNEEDSHCIVTGGVKLVTQDVTPGIDRNSFRAKPKTLYRRGMHGMRMVEQPDPEQGIHGLIVTRDRDSWLVNLATGTGQHVVDTAESYTVHVPLVPLDSARSLIGLELGCELGFMKQRGVRAGVFKFGNETFHDFAVSAGEIRLRLLVNPDTGLPAYYVLKRNGELLSAVRYLEYETGLELPDELFSKPAGITYSEAEPTEDAAAPEE